MNYESYLIYGISDLGPSIVYQLEVW